jgi:RNA polymerase sigma factor (sigma-70 family)
MPKARRRAALWHLQTLFDAGTIGELTDGQLLKWFATRDGEAAELAFSALVERHGPMVLRTCRSVLHDSHDAEDAFQATFLVLVKKARRLWVRDSLGPWLHQVAYRVSSSARAGAAQRRKIESRAAESVPRSKAEAVPDDFGGVLHEELGRLPDRYRAAVVLCCLEGLTLDQAARRLGWPLGTVQSRLARGRQRLRDRLTRRGLAPWSGAVGVALAAERPRAAVSTALAEATARVAICVAAGEAALEAVPAAVVALSEGVLKTMALSKLKLAAVVLLLGVGIGSGLIGQRLASQASAQEKPQTAGARPSSQSGNSSKSPNRETYEQALAVMEAMARERPGDAEYRAALARSYLMLGTHLQMRGRTGGAEESYGRARALLEALAGEQPEIISHRIELARVFDRFGTLLGATGRQAEAMETHRRAIAIQERLAADHPTLPQVRGDLSRSYSRLGTLLQAIGRPEEAERLLQRALDIQRRLVESQPELVEPRSDLADSYEAIASLMEGAGRTAEAEQALRLARSIREALVAGRVKSGK